MRDNWKDKFRLFLRHRIPLVTTFILMFMFFVPINSLELNYLRPAVGIICVYYWTLKRPYLFSYISAFWVGFLADIYSSTPLGVNIFIMMLLVFATTMLFRFFSAASFGVSWLMFGVVNFVVTVIKWGMLMVYFQRYLSFQEILFSFFSTVMFYPLVAFVNIWIQNNMLPQERLNE